MRDDDDDRRPSPSRHSDDARPVPMTQEDVPEAAPDPVAADLEEILGALDASLSRRPPRVPDAPTPDPGVTAELEAMLTELEKKEDAARALPAEEEAELYDYQDEPDESISNAEIAEALSKTTRRHRNRRLTSEGVRRTLRNGRTLCQKLALDGVWRDDVGGALRPDVLGRAGMLRASFGSVNGFRAWIRRLGEGTRETSAMLYDASPMEMEWWVRCGTTEEEKLPAGVAEMSDERLRDVGAVDEAERDRRRNPFL